MNRVTVEQEYLGHNFKLTLESDVTEDLTEFNVDGRIHNLMRRVLQTHAENTAVALNDRKAAQELEEATRKARADGKFAVDATVGRGPRRFAIVDQRGPSVVLGAGGKETERRMVVGQGGRLLRTKPGTEVVAAEDGGNQ